MHEDLAKLKSTRRAFTRAGWVFELMYDGFRVLAKKEGTDPSLVSRNGTDLLRCFPDIGAQLRALPPIVLDGELVVLDDKGRPLFERLRRRFAMQHGVTIQRAAISEPAALFTVRARCGHLARLGGRRTCTRTRAPAFPSATAGKT